MMPRMEDIQVVVMMGGVGSRLGDIVASCPKPLLPVGKGLPDFASGKTAAVQELEEPGVKRIPFFEYELRLLLVSGFRKSGYGLCGMSRDKNGPKQGQDCLL